jgi:hypothetical protein
MDLGTYDQVRLPGGETGKVIGFSGHNLADRKKLAVRVHVRLESGRVVTASLAEIAP